MFNDNLDYFFKMPFLNKDIETIHPPVPFPKYYKISTNTKSHDIFPLLALLRGNQLAAELSAGFIFLGITATSSY